MSMIIWKRYTISFGSFLVHFRFFRSLHGYNIRDHKLKIHDIMSNHETTITMPCKLPTPAPSGPFMWCLYSWTLPVSGQIIPFIWTDWMVTSPVLVSLIAQSYPVWKIVTGEGAGVGSLHGIVMVVSWLAIMSRILSLWSLMLYPCILGTGLGSS